MITAEFGQQMNSRQVTDDFIAANKDRLYHWFRLLDSMDESRLFHQTMKIAHRRRRELFDSSFSQVALYRIACNVMARRHPRLLGEKADVLHVFLMKVGFTEDDVGRILRGYDVVIDPNMNYDDITVPQVADVMEGFGAEWTPQRVRGRHRRLRLFSLTTMLGIVVVGAIIASYPPLRRASHVLPSIQSIQSWWKHRQNPYVDWLPFTPLLPPNSLYGNPTVNVELTTPTTSPTFTASYNAQGVIIEEEISADVTYQTNSWKPESIANQTVRVSASGQQAEYIHSNTAVLFFRQNGTWTKAELGKIVPSLTPYRSEPVQTEYHAFGPQAAQKLHFPARTFDLPSSYVLEEQHILEITVLSTKRKYQNYELDYQDGSNFIAIDESMNVDYFMREFQKNLFHHKVKSRSVNTVYDNGQSTAVVVPGTPSILVLTSGDRIPFLQGFVKTYIGR